MHVNTEVYFSTLCTWLGTGNWEDWGSTTKLYLGRYYLIDWKQGKIYTFLQTFSTTLPLPVLSLSIWQDTVWEAPHTTSTGKEHTPFYSLSGITKLLSLTLTHTLTLMLLLPCMPGELNNVSVWILPSAHEAFFFQLLSPINLVLNQSTNTLVNKKVVLFVF